MKATVVVAKSHFDIILSAHFEKYYETFHENTLNCIGTRKSPNDLSRQTEYADESTCVGGGSFHSFGHFTSQITGPSTVPVSYTHLDVYKRQRLLRAPYLFP